MRQQMGMEGRKESKDRISLEGLELPVLWWQSGNSGVNLKSQSYAYPGVYIMRVLFKKRVAQSER